MKQPNVILVMTDDQGYGDLGCTGNPWINTPHIDAFHNEASRLNDFHVEPLCTPTRGALMTGHRPVRNGAWATCWGRSILDKNEATMADVFLQSGYRTAMFGKWHLGDNYPYRPQDRGFQHVVAHKGGGVGQTPDFWGNNYFDDTYFHNGKPVEHTGYCTDVWFDQAIEFISSNKDKPFFTYIATNAPHCPYLVADKYKKQYENNPAITSAAFYGMISNIDENFGKLRSTLQDLGIEDNTILIFMTDNGSSGGCHLDENKFVTKGYNGDMRGNKADYYNGGHRVPFFIRWPDGNVSTANDINQMALHIDVLPTLIDLCGLQKPDNLSFDGVSFAPLLNGTPEKFPENRVQFLQFRQNTEPPKKWENAIISPRWRLINGTELYDIKADPGERNDVAETYPEVVAQLRAEHEAWWDEISPDLAAYNPISIGSDEENPTRLDAMDVMGDVAWHQTHIVKAQKSTGNWNVLVEQPGTYTFRLRRWPEEFDFPIDEGVSAEEANKHIYNDGSGTCGTIHPVSARIKLLDIEKTTTVKPGEKEACFSIEINQTGQTVLDAWFADEQGEECGAYYVYIERT